ncbi:PHP domain-containing protein [Chakrabartyella piscis]|uniref:PHP domain-containing protein n=1 Tax=Chakrabartyella piscis TaxID=2918914 RepID=UPI002958ACFD|nr:PHP domain-containing protein [Chakrabartyella piscis]
MDFLGFSKDGKWYKGNLHSHTNHTDGKLTPKELVELYQKAGYDFLAITDHDVFYDYRETLQPDGMVLLPAVEASAYLVEDTDFYHKVSQNKNADSLDILWDANKVGKCKKAHHINAILGTKAMQEMAELPLPEEGKLIPPPVYLNEWKGAEVLQTLVEDFKKRGFFVTYNHSTWSQVELEDVSGVDGIWAMEIYNYGTHITNNACDETFVDNMMAHGNQMHILATDDNHNWNPDSFGGYIMVKAENLSHDTLVESMLAGNYYSSTGCEIYDWGIRNDEVFVACEDCKWIRFIINGCVGDGKIYRNEGEPLCVAKYKLKGTEKSVRVECINHNGERAWTNFCMLQK